MKKSVSCKPKSFWKEEYLKDVVSMERMEEAATYGSAGSNAGTLSGEVPGGLGAGNGSNGGGNDGSGELHGDGVESGCEDVN